MKNAVDGSDPWLSALQYLPFPKTHITHYQAATCGWRIRNYYLKAMTEDSRLTSLLKKVKNIRQHE